MSKHNDNHLIGGSRITVCSDKWGLSIYQKGSFPFHASNSRSVWPNPWSNPSYPWPHPSRNKYSHILQFNAHVLTIFDISILKLQDDWVGPFSPIQRYPKPEHQHALVPPQLFLPHRRQAQICRIRPTVPGGTVGRWHLGWGCATCDLFGTQKGLSWFIAHLNLV